jgi:NDP-sugar pyrophosphorylase family protein
MKPTLLILAAGMGSRYGGIKQLDSFGPNGETIIDYSLFDAIRGGFGKVVFIIREELKEDFEATFGPKLKGKIDYDYAIQGIQSYVPAELGEVDRSKPWGTGHAMLCAWEQTETPFAVINADDFYGADAFKTLADFLSTDYDDNLHAMVGYQVKNTLSENGTVSRGVCRKNEEGNLAEVIERTKILRDNTGKIVFLDEGEPVVLDENAPVSMNFWGFKHGVFQTAFEMFQEYAKKNYMIPKAEFFIPLIASNVIESGTGNVKVFDTASDWFGVTYPEDKPEVQAAISKLINEGKYPEKLWD